MRHVSPRMAAARIACSAVAVVLCSCTPQSRIEQDKGGPKKLVAHVYNSGFAQAHDTYNGMGTGSDGKIYYVLCTESSNVAGHMFSLDPSTGKVSDLGDLTEASGE